MTLKTSLINHLQSGTWIFAAKQFRNGDVVEHYNGSLVTENMTPRQHKTKMFREAFMQMMHETFLVSRRAGFRRH